MAVNFVAPTTLSPVKGVRLACLEANIRYKDRDDLTLIELAEGSSVAGVFTQNAFCAAPVTVCREHLETTEGIRYLIINAGNANAGTGEEGLTSAQMICAEVAEETMSALNSVLPFSTGVIGEQLPYWKIVEQVPNIIEKLSEDNWMQAATAIMTTDTTLKGVSKSLEINGKKVTFTGMVKGAGMIEPNMATLLAYVATDAGIDNASLQCILNCSVRDSFNSITVDGDTSTNDSLILMATGQSGVVLDELADDDQQQIIQTIRAVCQELAQAVIRDAEGATKFVTIEVEAAPDYNYAKEIAYSVARSPLVKTALFASDPNWGRLLMAIGKTPVKDLDVSKLSLWLGETQLIEAGEPLETYQESQGQTEMDKDEITIRIQLNAGDAKATVWTSDLSHEYVTINAEYRS
ncbi:MAG TPA: bifunctional glutamate N-acetyltransferase/amino-acid acetyltransferase ArgJ [Leucothrix mucor]|nr:bifunctional glutamate N-acetyltransferase/amino-acid acetyltransferase ArgJ [Leucothrix mucor]